MDLRLCGFLGITRRTLDRCPAGLISDLEPRRLPGRPGLRLASRDRPLPDSRPRTCPDAGNHRLSSPRGRGGRMSWERSRAFEAIHSVSPGTCAHRASMTSCVPITCLSAASASPGRWCEARIIGAGRSRPRWRPALGSSRAKGITCGPTAAGFLSSAIVFDVWPGRPPAGPWPRYGGPRRARCARHDGCRASLWGAIHPSDSDGR